MLRPYCHRDLSATDLEPFYQVWWTASVNVDHCYWDPAISTTTTINAESLTTTETTGITTVTTTSTTVRITITITNKLNQATNSTTTMTDIAMTKWQKNYVTITNVIWNILHFPAGPLCSDSDTAYFQIILYFWEIITWPFHRRQHYALFLMSL